MGSGPPQPVSWGRVLLRGVLTLLFGALGAVAVALRLRKLKTSLDT